MGVHILESKDGEACLYCSTSMWAFGPIFEDGESAEDFLQWSRKTYNMDPRSMSDTDLQDAFDRWLDERGRAKVWEKE